MSVFIYQKSTWLSENYCYSTFPMITTLKQPKKILLKNKNNKKVLKIVRGLKNNGVCYFLTSYFSFPICNVKKSYKCIFLQHLKIKKILSKPCNFDVHF